MAASAGYQWRRDKDGTGVWEHRGKVAVAGVGHSPVDRRRKPSPSMGEGWEGVMLPPAHQHKAGHEEASARRCRGTSPQLYGRT